MNLPNYGENVTLEKQKNGDTENANPAGEIERRLEAYWVVVQFQPYPHGETYADLFMAGYDTSTEHHDAEEVFTIDAGD